MTEKFLEKYRVQIVDLNDLRREVDVFIKGLELGIDLCKSSEESLLKKNVCRLGKVLWSLSFNFEEDRVFYNDQESGISYSFGQKCSKKLTKWRLAFLVVVFQENFLRAVRDCNLGGHLPMNGITKILTVFTELINADD